MSELLKKTLKIGEEKLSWIITVEYEIILEEESLLQAIMMSNYQWLFYVWASKKNYFGNRNDFNAQFITFEQLFDIMISH